MGGDLPGQQFREELEGDLIPGILLLQLSRCLQEGEVALRKERPTGRGEVVLAAPG